MFWIVSKIEKNGRIIGVSVMDRCAERFIPKKNFGMLVRAGVVNANITKDGKIVANGKGKIEVKQLDDVGLIDISKLRDNEYGSILFHGSPVVIRKPIYGKGNPENDYGVGFYCTRDYNLACEWSCKSGDGGIVNAYRLNTSGLRVLNLGHNTDEDILRWVAILLENRVFDDNRRYAILAKRYFREKKLIKDYRSYDVIVGYRADDSYFSYVSDFISGQDTLESLSRALKLGNLGIQVVPISKKAINRLQFLGFGRAPKGSYDKFTKRDRTARNMYFNSSVVGGTTIVDILRKEGYLNEQGKL